MKKRERIEGLLVATAVADAMAGPHHGRSTAELNQLLEEGGWVDSFDAYSETQLMHWRTGVTNVVPGTFTSDSQLRHLLVDTIILNEQRFPGSRMSPNYLAMSIIIHYRTCLIEYDQVWQQFQEAVNKTTKDRLHEKCKESFVTLWFAWELTKIATNVYLPQTLPLFSPPAMRVNRCTETGEYTGNWYLEPIKSEPVTPRTKSLYRVGQHDGGTKSPLGLIGLLPLAIYWKGNPRAAYRYTLEMNFFDMAPENLYTAVFGALLSDLLGGVPWEQILKFISHNSIQKFVGEFRNPEIQRIQRDFELAIAVSQEYHRRDPAGDRKNDIAFLKSLHRRFADEDDLLGTAKEVFSVAVALMEYAGDDVPLLIELGVNYGRENGVVAALAASLAGAANGIRSIPKNWRTTVEKANPTCDFHHLAKSLSVIEFD